MTENILFICGSLNQTTQLHQIAQHIPEYNCYFTPYYADGIEGLIAKTGLLDFTVLGGRHQQDTRAYLASQNLPVDERGEKLEYDLVVTSSDLIIQTSGENALFLCKRELPSRKESCTGYTRLSTSCRAISPILPQAVSQMLMIFFAWHLGVMPIILFARECGLRK